MGPEVRTRVTAGAVLGLVFVAGLTVGLALDGTLARGSTPGGPDSAAGAPEAGTHAAVDANSRTEDKILKRIDLTPRQWLVVDSLLQGYHGTMAEFQGDYRPRYWAIVDSTRAAIQSVLDPEQAVLYDSLLVENDKRRGRPGSEGC